MSRLQDMDPCSLFELYQIYRFFKFHSTFIDWHTILLDLSSVPFDLHMPGVMPAH